MNKIIQWNIRGFYNNLEELKQLISQHQPPVICIQETHLKPKNSPKLANYTLFRHDHTSTDHASGGVATAIHNSIIIHKEYKIDSELQHTTIQIQMPNLPNQPKITVSNIYIPPNQNIRTQDITNITSRLQAPYIILGDLNAHNRIWGSSTNNNRGNIIQNILENCDNLILLNNGQPTRFNALNGTCSAIDITMATNDIAYLLQWNPHNDLCNSDHFPLFINLQAENLQSLTSKTRRWNIKKADWNKFKSYLQQHSVQISENIDVSIAELIKNITEAANLSIPKSNGKHTKEVPWWCPEIKTAIKDRNKALNKFRITKLNKDLQLFRKLRAKARQLIRSKKRESWGKFVQGINVNTSNTEMWNKIRILRGTKTHSAISLMDSNKKIITDEKQIANIFAHQFAFNSSDDNYSQDFIRYKAAEQAKPLHFAKSTQDTYNSPITMNELEETLKIQIKNSAPGPDNIPVAFIKHLPNETKSKLLQIYNKIWTEGTFPNIWSTAIVLPIPKANKDNKNPENFRPIALTCVMCKILEKIIAKRLTTYFRENQSISSSQCGFQKGRSTIDQLVNLESDIQHAFKDNKKLLAIFFDLEKAYDKAWRHHIIKELLSIGLQGEIILFIKNFLQNRSIQVRINNTLSSAVQIANGTPQGSILSVHCFIIAINNITKKIPPPIKYRLFADDLNISIQASNIRAAQSYLQICLHNLEEWCQLTGFSFSPHKTKFIIFSRKKIPPPTPPLTIYNKPITYALETKFLGLTFDYKLSWTSQLNELKARGANSLNILKMLNNKHFLPNSKTLLTLYRSLIRSKIDYGCIVYRSAKPKQLNRINQIHNTGIRMATGAYITSPIKSLMALCGEPTLELRRKLISVKYATSVIAKLQTEQHPNQNIILMTSNHEFENFYTRYILDLESVDQLPPPSFSSQDVHRKFLPKIQNLLFQQWNTEWNTLDQNKLRSFKPHVKDWTQQISTKTKNNKQSRIIHRLLIGHARTTHEYLLTHAEPPVCQTCNVQITTHHILYLCTQFQDHPTTQPAPLEEIIKFTRLNFHKLKNII